MLLQARELSTCVPDQRNWVVDMPDAVELVELLANARARVGKSVTTNLASVKTKFSAPTAAAAGLFARLRAATLPQSPAVFTMWIMRVPNVVLY